jgi:hypothetical protein
MNYYSKKQTIGICDYFDFFCKMMFTFSPSEVLFSIFNNADFVLSPKLRRNNIVNRERTTCDLIRSKDQEEDLNRIGRAL